MHCARRTGPVAPWACARGTQRARLRAATLLIPHRRHTPPACVQCSAMSLAHHVGAHTHANCAMFGSRRARVLCCTVANPVENLASQGDPALAPRGSHTGRSRQARRCDPSDRLSCACVRMNLDPGINRKGRTENQERYCLNRLL